MDIRIMLKDACLSAADETYLTNRLCFGLAANHRDVDAVEVSVNTVPGVEPGTAYRCRVDISLVDGASAPGECRDANLYVAIDRAIDRACGRIIRNVDPDWRCG